jgi:hypothetical protein
MTRTIEFTGAVHQGLTPDWEPLLEALGDDLTRDFMWMFEVRLSNGVPLQAYKHVKTRRYLHLAPDGASFMFEAPDNYVLIPNADVAGLARTWRELRLTPG